MAILSGALAVLITLSIIFVYHLIRLIKQFDKIAQKAERVASNVEMASEFFRHSTKPFTITRFVTNVIKAVKSTTKKGSQK